MKLLYLAVAGLSLILRFSFCWPPATRPPDSKKPRYAPPATASTVTVWSPCGRKLPASMRTIWIAISR